MSSLLSQLELLVKGALQEITGQDMPALIAPTRDQALGDYQCNAALSLAKKLKQNPKNLAEEIIEKIRTRDKDGIISQCTLAGPGFVNIRLNDKFILDTLKSTSFNPCNTKESAAKVVVDYSCPNIAKQMHVGHLRSSIIGDAISRVLIYQGYNTVRQNHVGDWGTQFGLLCAWLMDRTGEHYKDVDISDLEALYKASQDLAAKDQIFHDKARNRVVALQSGDKDTLEVWQHIVNKSLDHIENAYRLLNVLLNRKDVCGESFYNPMLKGIVDELLEKFPEGSRPIEVIKHQDAICVFLYDEKGEPLFRNAEDDKLPFIIRKSDGAYLYATTDLAAMRYRLHTLKAQRIIYVTDARQALHFKMLFATVKLAGWMTDAKLEHVTFGTVLGPDNKPFKTRSGENVKLMDLLNEAVERAKKTACEGDKKADFSEEEINNIAKAVGIASVKYADLSQNRMSDYVFSFDRMLAMEGNTAPYLMYAYARIRSIQRKAGQLPEDPQIIVTEPQERNLLLHLARFGETINQVSEEWRINILCDYLYTLSGLYMKFYENCPVINAPSQEIKASRLGLCDNTAKILKLGLNLLGIETVERM